MDLTPTLFCDLCIYPKSRCRISTIWSLEYICFDMYCSIAMCCKTLTQFWNTITLVSPQSYKTNAISYLLSLLPELSIQPQLNSTLIPPHARAQTNSSGMTPIPYSKHSNWLPMSLQYHTVNRVAVNHSFPYLQLLSWSSNWLADILGSVEF